MGDHFARSRSGPSRQQRRLRLGLGAALGTLITTGLVVSATSPAPGSAGPVTPSATAVSLAPTPATPSTSPPPAGSSSLPTTSTTSTTSTPPATVGPRPSAGSGCGLSLTATAPQPVGHCTVLEIGDSLGKDLGWGLDRQVPPATGLNLVLADQSSTGLVNTSFFDWRATLAADLAQYHPQLVLVCLGGNDEQGMMVNGSAQQFPSAPWQAAYLARVRQLVAEATGSGAYLLWVGMPIMGIPGYSAGMQILNGIYQQAVASDPNAVFVPLWQLFSGPGGSFAAGAQVNGKAASLRQADDIHYSVTGEDVAATYVAQQLAARFHIQLAPADPQVITGW